MRFEVWGSPIEHSLSPTIHQSAFDVAKIEATYGRRLVGLDDVADCIQQVRSGEIAIDGLSATMPLKSALLDLVDEASDEARRAGGVNTIRVDRDGESVRLVATSTDGRGFCNSLGTTLNAPHNLRVQIVGAGGSAHAVAIALLDAGVGQLTVNNRDNARAEALAVGLRSASGCEDTSIGLGVDRLADVCVFCVPREGERSQLSILDRFATSPLVVSLSYGNPAPSAVVAARLRGWPSLDGLTMLVAQAELAFGHWFGRPAPVGAYRPPQ